MGARKALAVAFVVCSALATFIAYVGLLRDTADRPPRPDATPRPGAGVTESDQYRDYLRRCRQATTAIVRANVVFDPEMRMTRGSSFTVKAIVTLKTQLPPDEVLPGRAATSAPLYVACEVEGSLSGDSEEFGIQPAGWQSRSLVGGQDADWTWLVKPKVGGTHSLVMALRPVVKISEGSGALQTRTLTTASFESTVHVRVPTDQAIADAAARAKVMFDSLSALVKALTVLVLAITAFAGALGIRGLIRWIRERRRRESPRAERTDTDVDTHDNAPTTGA